MKWWPLKNTDTFSVAGFVLLAHIAEKEAKMTHRLQDCNTTQKDATNIHHVKHWYVKSYGESFMSDLVYGKISTLDLRRRLLTEVWASFCNILK